MAANAEVKGSWVQLAAGADIGSDAGLGTGVTSSRVLSAGTEAQA